MATTPPTELPPFPSNADAYRGLGLAQMRSRDPAAADSLRRYLAMKPNAVDSAMISTLIQ